MLSRPPGPRLPLLIVEDDPDVRDAFSDVLDEAGFAVFTAANGADALALLPELPPLGLVLLDLMMPRMNGLEFLARVREQRLLTGVPIFVISASMHVETPPGITGFLAKPVELDALLEVAARHCGDRAAAETT